MYLSDGIRNIDERNTLLLGAIENLRGIDIRDRNRNVLKKKLVVINWWKFTQAFGDLRHTGHSLR